MGIRQDFVSALGCASRKFLAPGGLASGGLAPARPSPPGFLLAGIAAATVLATAIGASAQPQPPAPPSLSEMDANGDGRVTTAEFDAFMANRPHRPGPGPGPAPDGAKAPPPPPSDKKPAAPPPTAPGDAKRPAQPAPVTGASIDANHDGVVSEAEFAAALAQRPRPGAPAQ